jgi:hypothetical protein
MRKKKAALENGAAFFVGVARGGFEPPTSGL